MLFPFFAFIHAVFLQFFKTIPISEITLFFWDNFISAVSILILRNDESRDNKEKE